MKTIRKTKAKRILSLLLALMMIISAAPLSGMNAFAAESGDYEHQVSENSIAQTDEPAIMQNTAYEYDVQESAAQTESGDFEYEILKDGTTEITGYNGTASDIVIPSEIDGYKVTSIGMLAFLSNISLVNVTISEGITNISDSAFLHCKNIKNLSIPNSLEKIDSVAFGHCISLETVDLPGKLSFISPSAFEGCTSLTEINIASDNAYYSSEDGVLFNKEKTEIHIFPNGREENNYVIPDGVVSIADSTFSNCTKLTGVTIPNSVTSIESHAFNSCTNLTSIDIPESVTTIGYGAFWDCINLKSVTMSDNVIGIGGYAFSGCTNLTNIILSNKVTQIRNNTFDGCISLTNVVVPDSVEFISYSAFENCSRLTNITIPAGVTDIDHSVFTGCTSLAEINVAEENTHYSSLDGILFNKDQTEIIRYPEGKPDENYTIPSSVSDISSQAFDGCTNLAEINVAEENVYYSSLDGILFNKDQTEIIRYPAGKLNTDYIIPFGVTDIICGAFRYCTSLIDITIPNSVTTIEDGSFCYCTSLKKIFIPDSVIFLGFMTGIVFEGCDSLTIYGYEGTAAETYANTCRFKFIALDKKVDSTTGISVAEKELDILPDGAEIKVEQLSAEDNKIIFDISLVKDGTQVQPNGEVTVKIPVPEGMDATLLKVYREEANGSFTDMNAYFANGYMVFTTDHFSKYVLTTEEPSSALPGDINGDGKVTAVDARWILQIAAGTRQVTEAERKSVDLNKDGKVTAVDARWVLQVAVGTRVL